MRLLNSVIALSVALAIARLRITPCAVEVSRLVKWGWSGLDSIRAWRLRQPRATVGANLVADAIRKAALSTDHLVHPQRPHTARRYRAIAPEVHATHCIATVNGCMDGCR